MQINNSQFKTAQGFSLVEMAIVLVIVGLVIGALFAPLAAQRNVKDLTDTQSSLNVIKEAIYGFAVLNGRLPCPTIQSDPTNANYGLEDCTINVEGYLPWKSLGVPEGDAWSTHRTVASDSWNGYWRYKPDSNFTTASLFNTNILATASNAVFANSLYIKDIAGNNITSTTSGSEKPIAVIYSTGKDFDASAQNQPLGAYVSNENTAVFDDMLIWITRPVLVNRMVSAGKLP